MCMTCDVEIKQKKDLAQLQRILEIFDHFRLKGTLFLMLSSNTYHIYEDSELLLNRYEEQEFGLHIHWGQSLKEETIQEKCLKLLPLNVVKNEMQDSLSCCRKLGFKPTSFRGGGLSQTTPVLRLIKECGFKVDSSVAPNLDERNWHQSHFNVPYRSWYFPSKKGYAFPAFSKNEQIGLLEVPVTRLIPSFRTWYPYTLTPTNPLFKLILHEWLFKSRWEKPLVVTPVIHSWGGGGKDFNSFLLTLKAGIEYVMKLGFHSMTMSDLYEELMLDGF